jgi:hypothetical protein
VLHCSTAETVLCTAVLLHCCDAGEQQIQHCVAWCEGAARCCRAVYSGASEQLAADYRNIPSAGQSDPTMCERHVKTLLKVNGTAGVQLAAEGAVLLLLLGLYHLLLPCLCLSTSSAPRRL